MPAAFLPLRLSVCLTVCLTLESPVLTGTRTPSPSVSACELL